MTYEALQKWADDYTAWLYRMADERKACLACEQDAYLRDPDTDLDAAMMGSRADGHGGPYCKVKPEFDSQGHPTAAAWNWLRTRATASGINWTNSDTYPELKQKVQSMHD